MRFAWLLLVAGCGRFGFDPSGVGDAGDAGAPDAVPCAIATGHDEDHDGVDDACDVCPHLPDPGQADGDGDGVGDACDPHPGAPGDRIAYFDPFTSRRPAWDFVGPQPVFDGEGIMVDARGAAVFQGQLAIPAAADVFAYGVHVISGGSAYRQPTLFASNLATSKYYFCEIYDQGGVATYKLTYTLDGTSYPFLDMASAQTPLEAAELVLTLSTGSHVSCVTSWPAARARLEGDVPAVLQSPDRVGFDIHGLLVRIDWFIQIHTDP